MATSGWLARSPTAPSRSIRTTSRRARWWRRSRAATLAEAEETGLHVQAAQSLEALGRRQASRRSEASAAAGKAAAGTAAERRRPAVASGGRGQGGGGRGGNRSRGRGRRAADGRGPRRRASGRRAPAGPREPASTRRPAGTRQDVASVDPFSQAETAATIEAIDAADDAGDEAARELADQALAALEQRAALAAQTEWAQAMTAASSELTRVRQAEAATREAELAAASEAELATAERESAAQAADAAPSRVSGAAEAAGLAAGAGRPGRAITARGRFPRRPPPPPTTSTTSSPTPSTPTRRRPDGRSRSRPGPSSPTARPRRDAEAAAMREAMDMMARGEAGDEGPPTRSRARASSADSEEAELRILVTGGAGYIGSVTAEALLAAGHEVAVLDDLSTGHRAAVPDGARLHVGSYGDSGRGDGLARERAHRRRPALRRPLARRRVDGEPRPLLPRERRRRHRLARRDARRGRPPHRVQLHRGHLRPARANPDRGVRPDPADQRLRRDEAFGRGGDPLVRPRLRPAERDPALLQRRRRKCCERRAARARDAPDPERPGLRRARSRRGHLRRRLPHARRDLRPGLHPRPGSRPGPPPGAGGHRPGRCSHRPCCGPLRAPHLQPGKWHGIQQPPDRGRRRQRRGPAHRRADSARAARRSAGADRERRTGPRDAGLAGAPRLARGDHRFGLGVAPGASGRLSRPIRTRSPPCPSFAANPLAGLPCPTLGLASPAVRWAQLHARSRTR